MKRRQSGLAHHAAQQPDLLVDLLKGAPIDERDVVNALRRILFRKTASPGVSFQVHQAVKEISR